MHLIFWFPKVNTNGDVTFESSLSQYVASSFPISGSHKIIAPFWTDIDIRNGGQLWYRLTTQDLMLEQGASEIRNLFPHILSFAASWIMVVTWGNVAVFGCREVGISCSLVCMYRFTLYVIKIHVCFYFHTFWYTSCQKYCKEDSLKRQILWIGLLNLFRYSILSVAVEDDQLCNTMHIQNEIITFLYHLSLSYDIVFVFVCRRALSVNNLTSWKLHGQL